MTWYVLMVCATAFMATLVASDPMAVGHSAKKLYEETTYDNWDDGWITVCLIVWYAVMLFAAIGTINRLINDELTHFARWLGYASPVTGIVSALVYIAMYRLTVVVVRCKKNKNLDFETTWGHYKLDPGTFIVIAPAAAITCIVPVLIVIIPLVTYIRAHYYFIPYKDSGKRGFVKALANRLVKGGRQEKEQEGRAD